MPQSVRNRNRKKGYARLNGKKKETVTADDTWRIYKVFEHNKWIGRFGHENLMTRYENLLARLEEKQKSLVLELTARFLWKTEYKEDIVTQLNRILTSYKNYDQYYVLRCTKKEDERKAKSSGLVLYEIKSVTVQRWILDNILLAKDVVGELSPAVSAFVPGRDILYNCTPHIGKKAIVCLDIKDFFCRVKWIQVFVIFREFGYGTDVAGMLAHLCTLNGSLPQGAPTSPMLSNLVLREVDRRIEDHCRERGIDYTRYADDLTFSSVRRFDYGHIIGYAKSLLEGRGFYINKDKTKVFHRNHSQTVTGIVVNDFPQVPRKYRRRIRQEMYYLKKHGIEDHGSRINTFLKGDSYIKHLLGKVNFALHINKDDHEMQDYRRHLHEILVNIKR